MTYMGNPYYPMWLDNLADDVTLEAAAMDGIASGADDVRSIVVAARQLYDHQEFSYAGPCGESGFLEDYSSSVRGMTTFLYPITGQPASTVGHYVAERPELFC